VNYIIGLLVPERESCVPFNSSCKSSCNLWRYNTTTRGTNLQVGAAFCIVYPQEESPIDPFFFFEMGASPREVASKHVIVGDMPKRQ
jgi:hypothetical protein